MTRRALLALSMVASLLAMAVPQGAARSAGTGGVSPSHQQITRNSDARAPLAGRAGNAGPGKRQVTPAISMGNGQVLVWLVAGSRISRARALARRPCFSFTYRATRTAACVHNDRWAKVRQTGRRPIHVPVSLSRESGKRFLLSTRQADLTLPAGKAEAKVWCARGCTTVRRTAHVSRLRIRSCAAQGPWFVRGAPDRIGRAVAITFDDGPGAITRDVFQILAQESVPATFFQVGVMIRQRPQLLPRMLARGHVIGNHTYSHPSMSGGDLSQITRTQRMVRRLTGFTPCLFRAPYGVNPPSVVALARSQGLVTVNWNVDPGDWRGLDSRSIARTTLAQARPGSIMVLHDGENHPQMVQALPVIISELRARGYRFLTVPELLRLPIQYRR